MSTSPKFSVHRKIEDSPAVAVHGQVTTRQHIVDLILDLVGYTPDRPLHTTTTLDPGCGEGAFIIAAAKRLLAAKPKSVRAETLAGALLGVEKDERAAGVARTRLSAALAEAGVPPVTAANLAREWVVCGDFLELKLTRKFQFVVGNPPYVRQEAIPKEHLQRYRKEFRCFYDRADLYVAFFERGLDFLAPGGVFGFICPDRFARNNYGKKLREYVSSRFAVRTILDLAQASPFDPEVWCYPGIFIIANSEAQGVNHLRLTTANPDECRVVQEMLAEGVEGDQEREGVAYHYYEKWFTGEQQWATESPAHLALLRKLEQIGPQLGSEESGCKVGIGVATGADKVFIVRKEQMDIEDELLVPIALTDDIKSGSVEWSGRYVISPFDPNQPQKLIKLDEYPKAKRYFLQHQAALKGRNVAKRTTTSLRDGWYRTIDRIYPELLTTPKLLIPDIKAKNLIVLEPGELYPHHNLYYVASKTWDLAALRSVLRSSVAKFFVWMYGVKMRGNFLRFQAQYLRRICLPPLDSINRKLLKRLQDTPANAPIEEVDALAAELFKLTATEMDLVRDLASD